MSDDGGGRAPRPLKAASWWRHSSPPWPPGADSLDAWLYTNSKGATQLPSHHWQCVVPPSARAKAADSAAFIHPPHPPGALVCGHRVHRKCWDAMLSAQAILPMPTPPMATPTPTPNSLWMLSGQAKDSSADALTPHCPVCRAWQGGESTAAPTSKRWYEQPPRD